MQKFATRNFLGEIVRCYSVDVQDLPQSAPTKERIGHHILVVDASGSMCGDIASVKEKIRKTLTLDEYRDSAMLVSLFSYSSSGDCIEHFTKVPVGDIVKSKNTKAQKEIGSLRARGMTCMTQALEAALKLAKAGGKDDLVAVSLHTDGYFNDPSPSAEFRKIDTLIGEFKKLPNVFVNTIGYREWCDFPILEKIANALSGKCFQAKDLKLFYDSIYDTTALLAGQTAPALYLEKNGTFDYQVFVSSDGKIVGGASDLSINGVKSDATRVVYRFKEISESAFSKMKEKEIGWLPALAFAKAQLAEGKLNAAKYALVSSQHSDLLAKHAKAISGPDLADFSAALEIEIFHGKEPHLATRYGLQTNSISVPALLEILAEHKNDFTINFRAFANGYNRRGLKRLFGTWEKDKLVTPPFKTEWRDDDKFVPVSGFEFNRNNATINMMIARPCKLLKDGAEVKELGGIKLALTDYKQYTLVGDGSVNVDHLDIKVTNKKLHKKLLEVGAIDTAFDPHQVLTLSLADRPLVDYATKFDAKDYDGLDDKLAKLHAADKLFGALLKEKSTDLSDEQLAELKNHYITPNLYVSFPTTNPYTDLKKAIEAGEVDTRVGFEVIIGSRELLDPSDLYSANEFLARFYECEGVKDPKKPKMTEWFNPAFKVKHKQLSSRVKVGVVDALMSEVFDDFFGLSNNSASIGSRPSFDDVVDRLTNEQKKCAHELDKLYREKVSPLVFFIGSSGLIPDDFGDVPALTPDQLLQKYPDVKLTKTMKEDGAFYDVSGDGSVIITVLRKQAYFTTPIGLEKIKEIEKAAGAVA